MKSWKSILSIHTSVRVFLGNAISKFRKKWSERETKALREFQKHARIEWKLNNWHQIWIELEKRMYMGELQWNGANMHVRCSLIRVCVCMCVVKRWKENNKLRPWTQGSTGHYLFGSRELVSSVLAFHICMSVEYGKWKNRERLVKLDE